jgi:hypothetical protein
MSFQQALTAHFPNAMPEADFVGRTYQALLKHGFNEPNTIACVSVCRDELTAPLVKKIYQTWGEAFNLSSLAGMLFAGKTGFQAAEGHAPKEGGRQRYTYFALPHIALGAEGEVGLCYRPGRAEASGACGALIAFYQEMVGGQLSLQLNPDDIEQSLLKQHLFRKIKYGQVPDLITLTKLTYQTILEDLERMISLTVDPAGSDYAVLTGIQIHDPDQKDYVWPGTLYVVVNGQRHELSV